MCELFGLSAAKTVPCREILREFYSHGEAHPNGWGIAFLSERGALIEKEPVCSLNSTYLKERLRAPVDADLLLAHIRLATKGKIEYRNTHPFSSEDMDGNVWTLIHNGTIFESDILKKYQYHQKGGTDSERILLCLVDRMNQAIREKGRDLCAMERTGIIGQLITDIAHENKVNLLISDGRMLYAHINYRNGLFIKQGNGVTFLSTRPLRTVLYMDPDQGESESGWEALPLNTLLAFRRGSLVYRRHLHNEEFFDSEEKIRFLYLDYAEM